MTKKPVNPGGFDRYRERLQDQSPLHKIDALFEMELQVALSYYHGSLVRAGWHLLCRGVTADLRGHYWNAVFRTCDKIGWTRLQRIPGTECFDRHSAKCDKMNCSDMDCVQSGIPKWFQKLTRMDRE